jgi:adenylate cyclase
MREPPLVLVVDDNPANLEILETRLTLQGYQVVTAVDGDEALVVAGAQTPDLILLDVMMPGKDGTEVCRELKGDPGLPFMPVILVTAKADPDDIVAGLDAGGDEYITTPVDHASLVARVRSILRIKALHDTVQEQAAQLEAWNRTLGQRVAAQVAEIERLGSLKRFLSPQVAELILSTGDERALESHRRDVTVVFCDLRGFTAFAETSEPEEVMGVLRQYHEALG